MTEKQKQIEEIPRLKGLEKILRKFKIRVKDIYIYHKALTHKSYANENYHGTQQHNERLEFLGDSVLSLIVTDYLFNKFRDKPEGALTKLRAKVVSRKNCARVCRALGIPELVLLSRGEIKSSGNKRVSILSNTLEAFIGAMYIDQGYFKTRKFIIKMFKENIADIINNKIYPDAKSRLQEYFMKNFNQPPNYIVEKEEGDDHKKKFYIKVVFNNKIYGRGSGKNKKEAAQAAALKALDKLKIK